jgi:hypothetical protein
MMTEDTLKNSYRKQFFKSNTPSTHRNRRNIMKDWQPPVTTEEMLYISEDNLTNSASMPVVDTTAESIEKEILARSATSANRLRQMSRIVQRSTAYKSYLKTK